MKSFWSILAVGLLASAVLAQQGLNSLFGPGGTPHTSFDSFEGHTYPDGTDINTIGNSDPASLGCSFKGKYVSRSLPFGINASDNMEKYGNSTNISGLNGGQGWDRNAYVSRLDAFPNHTDDTFQTYTNGANLNGQSGGENDGGSVAWNGSFVAH